MVGRSEGDSYMHTHAWAHPPPLYSPPRGNAHKMVTHTRWECTTLSSPPLSITYLGRPLRQREVMHVGALRDPFPVTHKSDTEG